ncbi:MAG: N-acyl-D-amino-acid deacylase family protein [Sphaerochaeta sp.]
MNEEYNCDFLLKNAQIVDGKNHKVFKGSVTIQGDSIKDIIKNEEELASINPKETLDVKNRFLFPGIIDFHGHSDLQVIRDPSMKCKLAQGITTEIAGNCGVGVYPIDITNDTIVEAINDNTRDVLGEGHYAPDSYNWHDFKTYVDFVRNQGSGTNIMYLQSHTALRCNAVLPNPNRAATDAELDTMCDMLDKSLSQGCLGFSSGLYYAPCVYATEKELIALLNVVKKHNKIFTVHHRCEGDDVIDSLKEVINLARITGVRLEISHLKAIGKDNQKYVEEMLSLIKKARQEKIDVAFDQYPYDFGSTSLSSMLPPSYLKLGPDKLRKALSSKEDREKIKALIIAGEGFDSLIKMCGFENIKIMYLEHNRDLEGLSLVECSKKLYGDETDENCYNAFFDILRDEKGVALMEDVTQSLDSMQKIMKDNLGVFGTDALYSGGELPSHPRSYHSVPHYLDLFYKKYHTLSLEELIYRATYKSAQRLSLDDRGAIQKGFKADIVICDLENLEDNSNSNTQKPSKGIDEVFVNGKHVLSNGTIIAEPSGKIITF